MQKMEKLPLLKDRKISEKEITKSIRDYLNLRGIFHWKQWQGLGSPPGIADILGMYRGRFLAIEVKTERGRLSEKQAIFLNRINEQNGIAFIARSVADVRDHLYSVNQNINEIFDLNFRGF